MIQNYPMSVSILPFEVQKFVSEEIASGHYTNEQELFVDAVRVLRELTLRHDRLRSEINDAIAQADRGEAKPLDVASLKERVSDHLARQGIVE